MVRQNYLKKEVGSDRTRLIIKLNISLNLTMGSHCGTLLYKRIVIQGEKYLCRLTHDKTNDGCTKMIHRYQSYAMHTIPRH